MIYLLATVLFFAAIILSVLAQYYVSYAFDRWGAVPNSSQLTGLMVGERLKRMANLQAGLETTPHQNSDHYDPRTDVVRLSQRVADQPSVLAMAVTAHELGHAQQQQEQSSLIQVRGLLLPAVRLSPLLSYLLIAGGLTMRLMPLVWVGIALFGLAVVFMFLTLPVEFDASRRGLRLLRESDLMVAETDIRGARQVLAAAALTYVAASVLSLAQLLRYMTTIRRL